MNEENLNNEQNDQRENPTPPPQRPHRIRIQRPRKGRLLLGVCAAFGNYFEVDPLLIRLIFVITLVFGGFWIAIIYIAAGLLLPEEKYSLNAQDLTTEKTAGQKEEDDPRLLFATFLIVFGGYLLLKNLGILNYIPYLSSLRELFLPALLIAAGLYLIYRFRPLDIQTSRPQKLHRSYTDKKLFGVCGGLADYFNTDSNLVRVLWILLTVLSFGAGIIIYVIFVLFVPQTITETKIDDV